VSEVVDGAEQYGTVGVSILLPDGSGWQRNGDRQFRAASVVKIPIMIEIFRQVERGERSLDDRFVLAAGDKAAGGGVLLHLHEGIELTLNDLIYLMIAISDNSATNVLIHMAGMDRVNALMRELGMQRSNLGREMKGRPAIEGEQENFATPEDYTRVVAAILDGTAAGSDSCAAMIAVLQKQQNPSRIARFLPEDESIRWGTKTGSNRDVTHDVGFVQSPDGTLVMAVMCEGFPDVHTGERMIGEIARAAFDTTGIVEPLRTS
jgi:beta-lactamase class A